ncbi:hypothetical protein ACPPVO_21355 [Dactylosporangium sp. McL0621]|uniref:hypothetical protein n=1 Tax=Dactylosporangium sp. McL0621 TaxID=3415678 RepID=UPI003CFB32F9
MIPTARRVAVSALAWSAGATAAVTVSLIALSSINPDNASGPPQQLAPDSLTHAVAASSAPVSPDGLVATSSAPVPPTETPARPAASAGSVQRSLASSGGTVVARCTGGSAYLVSWSPAQGYQVAHVERGPAAEVEVVFRNAAGHTRIEIEIRCVAGIPTLHDEGAYPDHN